MLKLKSLRTQELKNSRTQKLKLLLCLRLLGTVLRTALVAVGNTGSIKCTANNVVTYTGEILHTTTANEHDRVLLQVVTLTGDVRVDLLLVGQANTSHLTHSGIRLFRGCSVHTYTYATTLRAAVESRRLALVCKNASAFTY
jgi:hypothetical protein